MKFLKYSLVGFLLSINLFAMSSAFAEDSRVILDQLLTGDVPQLNTDDIQIPEDLKPGFHELQVEVLDETGVVSSRTALFCKDLKGELNFDNNCPDLLVTNQKSLRSQAKPYSPISDPVGTASLALVAFAVGATLLNRNQEYRSSTENYDKEADEDEMGDLGGVAAAKLLVRERDSAWGDRRRYINTKLFKSLDRASLSLATGTASFSNLFGRAILDARYLRAIFGNLTWLTIPVALVVTYLGLQEIENEALPMPLHFTIALVCIGIFDVFAGLCGAFIYLNFIFANGNLVDLDTVFTALGVSLLFFAPALLASKFRPLTRSVKDFASFWERLTDYLLASLLTGWTVMKFVEALPGLAKIDLEITNSAGLIGLIAGFAVAARMLLEDFAWYLYPVRLKSLTIEIRPIGWFQETRAIVFRTAIFFLLAAPFIGFNNYLWAGCGMFVLPQLISKFNERLPKSRYLALVNPKGVFKIVLLGCGSIFAINYLETLKLSPADFILTSFVFLPLPALLFVLTDAFSGKSIFEISSSHKYRHLYRVLGILILGLLLLLVFGKDPYIEFKNFLVNFPTYWTNFISILEELWINISESCIAAWNWISSNAVDLWNWLVQGWNNSVSF